MSKLTLSVDDQVVSSAKRYAKQRGLSVSEMVEAYLAAVANAASLPNRDAPILRSVRGSLKKADLKDYRKHLAIKYR
jgi:antitoxin component of RelBE/YafQ-DinJ toxin-antitoxin module